MNKFDLNKFKELFSNVLKDNNIDRKYPSAYIKPLLTNLFDFIEWIINYVDEKDSILDKKIDEAIFMLGNRLTSLGNALTLQQTNLEDSNKKIDKSLDDAKKYTDEEIQKLKDSIGI